VSCATAWCSVRSTARTKPSAHRTMRAELLLLAGSRFENPRSVPFRRMNASAHCIDPLPSGRSMLIARVPHLCAVSFEVLGRFAARPALVAVHAAHLRPTPGRAQRPGTSRRRALVQVGQLGALALPRALGQSDVAVVRAGVAPGNTAGQRRTARVDTRQQARGRIVPIFNLRFYAAVRS
jgi:hypothetical protein